MKFKFLGVVWDFMPIISMAWVVTGCGCILMTFLIEEMTKGQLIIWLFISLVYITTGEKVCDFLMKEDK